MGSIGGELGFDWICAANAAEAHARLTQLNSVVFISISCSSSFSKPEALSTTIFCKALASENGRAC